MPQEISSRRKMWEQETLGSRSNDTVNTGEVEGNGTSVWVKFIFSFILHFVKI